MKLIEVIEEQLLQNFRNKVQTAVQNVGNKVNSLVNKNQPQQQTQLPTKQNPNQRSIEFNQFVEKYKNINSDRTKKTFGFGQSTKARYEDAERDATFMAQNAIANKMGETTTDGNKTTTISNLQGGFIPVDDISYGLRDQSGKETWYYAVVIEFEKSQQ
jgi:hypothetical protein